MEDLGLVFWFHWCGPLIPKSSTPLLRVNSRDAFPGSSLRRVSKKIGVGNCKELLALKSSGYGLESQVHSRIMGKS